MALYGPISLFTLAATWLVLTGSATRCCSGRSGCGRWCRALELSGSSIYTLGFVVPANLPTTLLAFSEAGFGLVLLAMLISYLPSMYQSFQRREAAVHGAGRAGQHPADGHGHAHPVVDHRRLGPPRGAVAGMGDVVRGTSPRPTPRCPRWCSSAPRTGSNRG
jgi:hypothetical protein